MPTKYSLQLLEQVRSRRDDIYAILRKYGASNPRIFGSVARGDANESSDIDIVYDYINPSSASFLSSSGIFGEVQNTLNTNVDTFAYSSLRPNIQKEIDSTEVIYV